MKSVNCILSVIFATLSITMPAFAVCTPGTSWTAAWTDQYRQTTYKLEAPCKVTIGIPFSMTATVTDSTYPNSDVGVSWTIKDSGTTVAGDGSSRITLVNGQWQRVVERTYAGDPVDHSLQFKFTDMGEGAGNRWLGWWVSGKVSVDPAPPAANAPPTADAGPALFIDSKDQNVTVVQGAAADADGNSLSYRWLEGAAEVQPSQPVGVSGAAPLDLAALPPLSIGTHTFTLEVSDGTAKVTDTTVVSVENSAPVAATSAGGTFNIGDDIRLNGSVADYDGNTLSYRWLEGTMLLAAGQVTAIAGGNPVLLPEHVIAGGLSLGTHSLTLEVTDGVDTTTAAVTVNVTDTTAPTLAPAASRTILWPPNGGMTLVSINANARDNSGQQVMLSVLVSSNQPNQPQQKGRNVKAIPDASVVSIDQNTGVVVLQLRNSRPGKGEDRVYSVTLTAADASGNSSSAEVAIIAPHDIGHRNAKAQAGRH